MKTSVRIFAMLAMMLVAMPYTINAQNNKQNTKEVVSQDKDQKIVYKNAKKLYKSKISEEKIKGMEMIVNVKGEKALPFLYKALKDNDVDVRRASLDLMIPYANEKRCAMVVKKYAKNDAVADIAKWLGDVKDNTHVDYLIGLLSSDDKMTVIEAVTALGKINNPDGLQALVPMIGGYYQPIVKDAFVKCEGDVTPYLKEAMQDNDAKKTAVMQILQERKCVAMHFEVRHLLFRYDNKVLRDAAYKALKNVVGVGHAEFLKEHLETCDEQYVTDVQDAMIVAMSEAKPEMKEEMANSLQKVSPEVRGRFERVLDTF